MHDPMTVALEIRRPWPTKMRLGARERRYWPSIATIWHVDPETDGTDDSCGWFLRARHGDQKVLAQIERDFAFEWSHGVPFGWFDDDECPNFSLAAIVLHMVRRAAFKAFGEDWGRADRFVRRNLAAILGFAENPVDSLYCFLTRHYERQCGERPNREERVTEAASIIYAWVLRQSRPWYRHPKWHLHHWQIQIHAVQALQRWLFSRCASCGGRFRWGYAPISFSWSGGGPQWFKSEVGVVHHACSAPVPLRGEGASNG